VVKKISVTGLHVISLSGGYHYPVGIKLGYSIGATGVEVGGFLLRNFLHPAVHFAGRRFVKTDLLSQGEDE
jgi:putative N-acetylmannosamine-6-phosphate epimerase